MRPLRDGHASFREARNDEDARLLRILRMLVMTKKGSEQIQNESSIHEDTSDDSGEIN